MPQHDYSEQDLELANEFRDIIHAEALEIVRKHIPRRTRSLTDIPLRRILRMSGSIRANGITMYPCRRVPGDGKA